MGCTFGLTIRTMGVLLQLNLKGLVRIRISIHLLLTRVFLRVSVLFRLRGLRTWMAWPLAVDYVNRVLLTSGPLKLYRSLLVFRVLLLVRILDGWVT